MDNKLKAYITRFHIKIYFKSLILINILTLPKYLSNNSTYRCIISKVSNSLSFCSIAQQKYKLAYLQMNKILLIEKIVHTYCRLKQRLSIACNYLLYTTLTSFHSKKLDIFGFRASIVVINSRVIFFFSLSGCATYHFCKRSFPWRLNSNINCICNMIVTTILYLCTFIRRTK